MPFTSGPPVSASRTAPVPSPSAVPFREHKYYRLPRPAHGEQLRFFDGLTALNHTGNPKKLVLRLSILRNIFAKDHLNLEDIQLLRCNAYYLLQYASQWDPKKLEKKTPSRVVEAAARRFLVTDSVWCVIQLLGPAMNRDQWWNRFMAHVVNPESPINYPLRIGTPDWRPLIKQFRDAIELYGQGIRPAALVVVNLKRLIFCDSRFSAPFRRATWNPWREDDDEFKRTSESR